MVLRRSVSVAALALVASLAFGGRAQAAYSYATTFTVDGGTTPGATIMNTATGAVVTFGSTTVTFTNVTKPFPPGLFVPGQQSINVVDFVITSTGTPGPTGDTFTIGYNIGLGITNNPPPGTAGSQLFNVPGSLSLMNYNQSNGVVQNSLNAAGSVTIGGILFSGALNQFAPGTVNGSGGNIGGVITTQAAIPEPSSIVMGGSAAALLAAAFGLRRRFT